MLRIECEPGSHPCKGLQLETLAEMLSEGELLDLELRSRSASGEWNALRVHRLIMVMEFSVAHAHADAMHNSLRPLIEGTVRPFVELVCVLHTHVIC